MGRNQVYCCICGAPFLEAGQCEDESVKWLSHVTILTIGRRANDGVKLDTYSPQLGEYAYALDSNAADGGESHVLQLDAGYDDHNRFPVTELGIAIEAFSVQLKGPLYLAVHKLCYQMAECFISSREKLRGTSQQPPNDEISSIKQLWEVMYRRMPGSLYSSEYILPDPYQYYGGRGCRNVYWELEDDPADGQILESNPLNIPGLTGFILDNLEPTKSEVDGDSQHPKGFSVTDDSQESWCEALANKKIFPWLWDLDVELVRRKQQDGDWDWKCLVRKLSKVNIHESSDATLSLPLGLRNRRRIWRCLEEARINDVASQVRHARP